MGTLSLTQTDRLYWLGRYLERVMQTLNLSSEVYDLMLDATAEYDVEQLCQRLAIPNIYEDLDDFVPRYLFDKDDPNSIVSNLERAFDNAVVMRDCIHSETLAYIQLADNAMKAGARSASPMLEIQEAQDYIYAFWGAIEDYVPDARTRYIMHTGRSVERVDLFLRLRVRDDQLEDAAIRLMNRLRRSGLAYDIGAYERIAQRFESGTWAEHIGELLVDVNSLVKEV